MAVTFFLIHLGRKTENISSQRPLFEGKWLIDVERANLLETNRKGHFQISVQRVEGQK